MKAASTFVRRILGPVCVVALLAGQTPAADSDAAPWPDDCNDGNSSVYPGAPQLCDGFDNDCNGTVDAGCPQACAAPRSAVDVPFATAAGASGSARLARTVDGFDAAWVDDRDGALEIYLGRFDRFGNLLEERRVSNDPADATAPSIASPGQWRAVVWVDGRHGNRKELYLSRLTDSGTFDIGEVRITSDPKDDIEPSLAWAGHRWAVAYAEGRTDFDVVATLINDNGAVLVPVGNPVSSGAGSARNPSLAYHGSGFGVVWQDDRHGDTEIYFRGLDADLVPTGPEVRLTNALGASTRPELVWTGDRFGLVWQDERDGNAEVYAALLDTVGALLAPEVRVSDDPAASESPRVTSSGAELFVTWTDATTGLPELRTARVGLDGVLLEGASTLVGPLASLAASDVVWLGDAPALVWEDGVAGELHAIRPRCCGDGDGDGVDRCDGDCDDARASVFPGAVEACNGFDDDCDGDLDDGCPRTCGGPDLNAPPLRHELDEQSFIGGVDLAWNGQTLGAAWAQDPTSGSHSEVVFQHLAADGTALAPPVRFVSGTSEEYSEPAVAAHPGGWLLVHQGRTGSSRRVYARALDLDGNPTGTGSSWTGFDFYQDNLQAVWDGRGFAVVYENSNTNQGNGSGAHFVRLSAGGVRIGDVRSFGSGIDDPGVAWSGSEYAVVWDEFVTGPGQAIWLQRFDENGQALGPEQPVSQLGSDRDPSIVWNGNGYGLLFLTNSSIINFRRLDATGQPFGTVVGVDGGVGFDYVHDPYLAWNGEEYWAQWHNDDEGKLYARRLAADGQPLGPVLELADSTDGTVGFFSRSAAVATGTGFVSGFRQTGGSMPGMYSRVAGCCALGDPDGDFACLADCDETDPQVYPGAPEICDGKDSDCDLFLPPEETTDADLDTFLLCDDCDDGDPERYPGAPERCNGLDDDCNGQVNGEGPFAIVENLRFSADKATLFWDQQPGSGVRYDTQRGSLDVLRSSGGDFTAATDLCLTFNGGSNTTSDPEVPPPGSGFAYYTSAGSSLCPGTYESGGVAQAEPRDDEVLQSAAACP
jgi:hypothetical protein